MTTPPPPPMPSGDGLLRPLNDDDKTMGMLAHGGAIFIGFLAPLLVMLIKKDSAFAQQESKEALNFQIVKLIALFICIPLMFICIGFILLPAVFVTALVFEIMAAVRVNSGEPYRYPITIRMIN
jgi:uncharacterized Tic20 family protein